MSKNNIFISLINTSLFSFLIFLSATFSQIKYNSNYEQFGYSSQKNIIGSNVTLIGRLATIQTFDVKVTLNSAYVADASSGLRIIDISDPSKPTKKGYLHLGLNEVVAVAINKIYAYVAGMTHGIRIIDISNPSNPIEISNYDTPHIANGIDADENYAYVADWGDGLRIIDISDPTSPTEVGYFNTQGTAYDVTVKGDFAYIADHTDGIRIIDISNPSLPKEVGYFNTAGSAWDVAVSGYYAFVADYTDGLRIIDISDPTNTTEIGSFDTFGLATGVAVKGNYAYVADGSDGLRIIDISNLSNPTETGFYDTDDFARKVTVFGNYIYVADVNGGLYIFQNDLVTDVKKLDNVIPNNYSISQNFPNPFNPSTKIIYQLPLKSKVLLKVYDILGKEVATLVNKEQSAGSYKINFDALKLSSGIYFYKITADKYSQIKKMILLK